MLTGLEERQWFDSLQNVEEVLAAVLLDGVVREDRANELLFIGEVTTTMPDVHSGPIRWGYVRTPQSSHVMVRGAVHGNTQRTWKQAQYNM